MAIRTLVLLPFLLIRRDAAAAHPPRSGDADLWVQSKAEAGVVPAELWCVAKNNAEDGPLQAALDWACGPGGADCRPVQQGGACYEPDDLQFHASFAFNDYFLRNGVTQQACDFAGTAALTSLDPGNKICHFPSSSSSIRNGSFTGTAAGGFGQGPAGADMSSARLVTTTRRPLAVAALLALAAAIAAASST